MQVIRDVIARHKMGERVGITSVCSAHPLVIEATLRHAAVHAAPFVLIEATSNQVNQDGGYTGMTPADFRDFVRVIADRVGFPPDRVALGGDHLGPNAWTSLPADEAMAKAEVMVADYVACRLRQNPPRLLDELRRRSGAASRTHHRRARGEALPGRRRRISGRPRRGAELHHRHRGAGARRRCRGPRRACGDDAGAALGTLAMHRDIFDQAGLANAWDRVVAAVVQPGVEFDHDKVVDYVPVKAAALSAAIEPVDHIVFEAHSTDYQTAAALAALVRDHFAILKVGPGLTFALREALWGLDAIERELLPPERRANLRHVDPRADARRARALVQIL